MEAQHGAGDEKKPAEQAPLPELHIHLLEADFAEDAVSSYRRREAVWISLVTHAIIVALLLLIPRWAGRQPVIIPIKEKQDTTFLSLPDDLQKVKTPPKTNIISDKDRVAQSRTPSPDKDTLRKLLDARRPGPPKPPQPQPQPAAPQQQAMQQNPATAQGAPAEPRPTPPPQTTAQMEALQVKPAQKSPFKIASPGATVSGAVQSVAKGHGEMNPTYGGSSGDYGSIVRPKTNLQAPMEILSDTLGVDFGPYMKRLRFTVMEHWGPLIPESASPPIMKKGVVVIQFSIGKDGKVSGMKLVASSGDVALDRAAWGAITDAIPLPRLPAEFSGQYLELRALFYYNPDKADME